MKVGRMILGLSTAISLMTSPVYGACEGTKLYDLSTGSITVDSGLLAAWQIGGTPVPLVIPVYLIDHPRGLILFDTGIAIEAIDEGCAAHWGAGLCTALKPEWRREDVFDRQLARHGFRLEQIKYVVYSHFHFDHTGNMEMLPDAKHIAQKAELSHAWWPEKLFRGFFVLKDFDETREFDFIEIEGDFDVFGDGCIRLIETPGHTPGHQSLLIQLPESGRILLTGDAVVTPEQLEGTPPGFTQDLTRSMESVERMKRIRDFEQATIWVSHDMKEFKARNTSTPLE